MTGSGVFLNTHRMVLWALIACMATFCAWAALARLDIVVSSHGKLVPAGHVKVARPVEPGIVRKVLVRDGEHVKAGQSLVEMDAVYAMEDSASASTTTETLRLQLLRIEAELEGRVPEIPDVAILAEFHGRHSAQAARLDESMRGRDSAAAELRTALERLRKYEELAPVTARQTEMLERLRASGFVSEAAYNQQRIEHVTAERERDIQGRAVQTAEVQLRRADAALSSVNADYHRQLTIERTETQLQLARAEAELHKQTHRASLQTVRAPVPGVVTGLVGLSEGQVVAAGATLLSIVPEDDPLRFEGWLGNSDSAFVQPGMPAKVKLSAYPFQKYGWLDGELEWVGVDAETPEAMRNAQGEPLFYRLRVTLPAQSLSFNEQDLALKPGMQATADLHIGTRTLLEYLLSPLRRIALEAGRER